MIEIARSVAVMGRIITQRDFYVNTYRVRPPSRCVKNDPMETFAHRLKRLRIKAELTQEQLALACGYGGQSRIANYEATGKNGRLPSLNEIPALAKALGVHEAELAAGLSESDKALMSDDENWPDVRATTQRLGLGSPVATEEYVEAHKLKFRADSLRKKRLNHSLCEIAYGKGDSMLPRIHEGDAILFNKEQTEPVNRKLFVIEIDGITGQYEPQVKRCRIIGGQVYFEAMNPDGDHHWKEERPMIDKRHPIRILGQVRWIGSWED